MILTFYITANTYERITLICFLLVVGGLLVSDGSDTVRLLIPMVYALILYTTITKKLSWIKILLLSFLPTLFGLYSYNLFITTFLFTIIFLLILFCINRKTFLLNKKYYILLFIFIILFQFICSLYLTHNMNYIENSLDSVGNYRYILNLTWTTDRSNVLVVFPFILVFLGGLHV